jgi:hypothetical protein
MSKKYSGNGVELIKQLIRKCKAFAFFYGLKVVTLSDKYYFRLF